MAKLTIKATNTGGTTNYGWDVIVDGHRVDTLTSVHSTVTIKRDDDITAYIRANAYPTGNDYIARCSSFEEKTIKLKHKILPDVHFVEIGEDGKSKDGCYVATAIYGSYDAPEVMTLRGWRDNTLSKSLGGKIFIKAYYAISPTLVKLFGETKWFNRFFKYNLDRFVEKLERDI